MPAISKPPSTANHMSPRQVDTTKGSAQMEANQTVVKVQSSQLHSMDERTQQLSSTGQSENSKFKKSAFSKNDNTQKNITPDRILRRNSDSSQRGLESDTSSEISLIGHHNG